MRPCLLIENTGSEKGLAFLSDILHATREILLSILAERSVFLRAISQQVTCRRTPTIRPSIAAVYSARVSGCALTLSQLRDFWRGSLVIKGILRADDAVLATKLGADGIVVSNHGGANSTAPIEVLADIVNEVGEDTTVIADSGVLRGSDILQGTCSWGQGRDGGSRDALRYRCRRYVRRKPRNPYLAARHKAMSRCTHVGELIGVLSGCPMAKMLAAVNTLNRKCRARRTA